MARSRKDGRRGGGHKSRNLRRDDFNTRPLKRAGPQRRRRTDQKFGFQEIAKHFKDERLAECCAALEMPVLDYRVCMDIARALQQSESPEDLLKFLSVIADKSDLLADNTYIPGLIALAKDKGNWIRSPKTWRVETQMPSEQFSELARHLLAVYDVPRFMDSAWLDGNSVHQNWFKHIGGGANIRTVPGLPFVLTKKMAHYFLTAPEDYTIAEALRFGQVHALGGNKNLADALRGTYLVRALNRYTARRDFWFVEDDFWISVIRFFIANPMLDVRHVSPIIDYIRHQKYTGQRVIVAGGTTRNIGPAHPNFNMKGRTPETLLAQVRAWHRELRRAAKKKEKKVRRRYRWKGSGGEFCLQQGRRIWHFMELTNREELYVEGETMGHCVSTYGESCRRKRTSIWAVAVKNEREGVWKKAVTIAVDLHSKAIMEVRGKFNRFPTHAEKSILEKWAAKKDLKVPSYLRV